MRRRITGIVLMLTVAASCSPAARDQLKRFFFEIPDDASTGDVAANDPQAPPDQPLEISVPQSRYVSIHQPFARHQCALCHDAELRMQVDEEFMHSCSTCHPRYFGDEVTHGPVQAGECSSCHVPHRSEQRSLLRTPVVDLCSGCHEEPEDLSQDAHSVANVEDCSACHDAHFGGEHLLKAGLGR